MSKQYFENNPLLPSKEHIISYYFQGKKLLFYTDLGVFSKREIDFGTNLLLKKMTVNNDSIRILDIGCGYGVIGIVLAQTNPLAYVEMVDVNERAIKLTQKNLLSNNITNAFVYKSNLYDQVNHSFDIIVSNPPIRAGKLVVYEILVKAFDYLNPQGALWIVIQKKQGALSAIEKLKSIYAKVEIIMIDKGYYIIKASK